MSSEHWYNSRGSLVSPFTPKAVPSVTTILDIINKPELHAWRERVGPAAAYKKMTESAQRGTIIHQLVSDWIEDRAVEPENSDHEGALNGYINWTDKAHPTDIESEVFLSSKKYRYAGTADIICRINGVLWLLDLKTSRLISPIYGLQIRAYEQALFEKRGEHARTGIIQLTDTVKAGYRFKELDEPLKVFLAAKTLHAWQHGFSKAPRFDGKTLYL